MKFKIALGRISGDIWANIRLRGIIRELKDTKNKRILNIGCENGAYLTDPFIQTNEITITDLRKENLGKDKRYINKFLDLTKKNDLKKEHFDIIICADVIEHIKDQDLAFKNLFELLKKGGILVFTSPAYSKLYGVHDKLIGHFRRYDIKDLKEIARKNNVELIKKRYLVSLILPLFIFLQKTKKSESIYNGRSKIEKEISGLLNVFCIIDEFLRLPFGICLMGIFKK